MNDNLPAVEAKIARILAVKPECFITHRAELQILELMGSDQVRAMAVQHGWRTVRRLGGRQIEFYNDASARANL